MLCVLLFSFMNKVWMPLKVFYAWCVQRAVNYVLSERPLVGGVVAEMGLWRKQKLSRQNTQWPGCNSESGWVLRLCYVQSYSLLWWGLNCFIITRKWLLPGIAGCIFHLMKFQSSCEIVCVWGIWKDVKCQNWVKEQTSMSLVRLIGREIVKYCVVN